MDCFRSRTKHSAKRSRLHISFFPFLVSFNLSTSSFVLDLGVKLRDPGCDNVQSVSKASILHSKEVQTHVGTQSKYRNQQEN
jgi:hypothetical protein